MGATVSYRDAKERLIQRIEDRLMTRKYQRMRQNEELAGHVYLWDVPLVFHEEGPAMEAIEERCAWCDANLTGLFTLDLSKWCFRFTDRDDALAYKIRWV